MEARGVSKTIHKGSWVIFLESDDNKAEVVLKNPNLRPENQIELRVIKIRDKYFIDGEVSFYTDEPTHSFYTEVTKEQYEEIKKAIEKIEEPEDVLNLASTISTIVGSIDFEVMKSVSKLAEKLKELSMLLKLNEKAKEMLENRIELHNFVYNCLKKYMLK